MRVIFHRDFVPIKDLIKRSNLIKEFIEDNNLIKDTWKFRPHSIVTAKFGIEEGWGPNMVPGYVRIHQGVDRARAKTSPSGVKDPVYCPLNFESSEFIDLNGKSYGSLVILDSKKFDFYLRIGHMNPKKDIILWALKQFKRKNQYKQNWLIGSAGTYGYSTGPHTHTELVSKQNKNELFESILYDKFGKESLKQYSEEKIISFYKNMAKKYPETSPYVEWDEDKILYNWSTILENKKIIFLNDHKCTFYWYNKVYTRYNTGSILKGF